jgi:CrcB protein
MHAAALVAWIIAFAALGAVARFLLHEWIRHRHGTAFPIGTLVVNLSGSLALGFLFGRGVGGDELFVIGTGGLGSYTTFSTWMFESERLVEEGRPGVAVANIALSALAGLAAVACGWALGAA